MEIKKRTYQTGSWRRVDAERVRLEVSMGTGLGGKRQRASRTVRAKTDAQAERALAAFVREMAGKRSTGGMTLGQLMDDYLEVHVTTLQPNTQRWYRDTLRRAYGALGHVRLSDLTAVMIERFYKTLADPGSKPFAEGYPNGLSATSVHHHHRALSAVLQWGYRHDLIDRPIIDKADAPEGGGKAVKAFALDAGQTDAYKTALHDAAQRYAAAVIAEDGRAYVRLTWELLGRLALVSGLRRGELLGVAWDDLSTAEGFTLHVHNNVQLINKQPTITQPKTALSDRVIDLPGSMAAEFQTLRQEQRAHFLRFGLGRAAFVFTAADGALLRPGTASHFFRQVLDAAGLPDATLHTLRHNCGTHMLAAGYSPADVAYYLGHSTPTTTLAFYAHAQRAQLRRMADVCEDLL